MNREELEEEVERLRELNARLAVTVLMVTYDAHPVYSNTTGPHGGVGGRAMTGWCNIINGGEDRVDGVWGLGIHTRDAREVVTELEVDVNHYKKLLTDEWVKEIYHGS